MKIDLEENGSVESIENYSVIGGIELIGNPITVSYREMAKHPRNKQLPKLKQLLRPKFYQKTFYDKTIQLAVEYLGNEKGLVEKVISSPVNIRQGKDNVLMFLYDFANYEQAVQFFRDNENGTFSIKGAKPHKYNSKQGLLLDKSPNSLKGLAGVEIFSREVDFRDYFKTPQELYDWKKDKNASLYVIQEVFDDFKNRISEKAKEIEDKKKVKIKGILLSPVKAENRLADGLFFIATNPNGEFLLGASYLV